ncbi:adenylate/guanylate cyclase domain-containing protein [Nannocystis sp.]|uniref:adenylate/guanylate cyclase domain-containing protein n=1 Tax=Nannocystis sp. TaxID=1962667 RepID=UPI002423B758|nr:adenylate/guanylate cyclase domain-containing protein [Nannocystis sp.]MBK7829067.1 adenylate/guanylate cyclase domain-containing protein [Nannocystis sp.]MBK9757538.1 adenylate/guanylate cyclase domain-containing protein [Nannocystis sp.]
MGARRETRLTTLARASGEYNERQVLAARALESERRVTAVRLVALALMAVSQGLLREVIEGAPDHDPRRGIVVAIYAAFAISAFVAVRRFKTSPIKARLYPLMATTFDVGFVLTMTLIDLRHGEIELEGMVTFLGLVISYSLLRYGAESVVYSTVLAIVAFTTAMHAADAFSWSRWSFVVFGFTASATLLWYTRVAVRQAFVDLKRRESLSRLVAPKVVDAILAGRESGLRPTRREVTLLFADIRDFTSYSESRAPEDVLRFLDDYFGRMTQVVQGHDGSVNKFLGDGLMALWGAPEARRDHAVHAVRAALDMQRVMREINEYREADGDPPLRIGIGVHTGEVAAGMLGSSSQSEYSVIGDAVNLASRIEGLTKQHGAAILVSEATWMLLGGGFVGERVGEVEVKGRRARVVIYTVTGRAGEATNVGPDVPPVSRE